MSESAELRKKAKRCSDLADGLGWQDAASLRELAAQLEQQADEAEKAGGGRAQRLH